MKTYIALLRGINVGGHKKVPMAELRELLTKSGLENVKTYIQSGNVIFQSSDSYIKTLESKIETSILDYFGFDVPVLVRTNEEIQTILNDCPFSEDKKLSSYFIILNDNPELDLINSTMQYSSKEEEFIITENCIYIFYALGAGKAKMGVNWFEKKLGVKATARNFRTMTKLINISSTY